MTLYKLFQLGKDKIQLQLVSPLLVETPQVSLFFGGYNTREHLADSREETNISLVICILLCASRQYVA